MKISSGRVSVMVALRTDLIAFSNGVRNSFGANADRNADGPAAAGQENNLVVDGERIRFEVRTQGGCVRLELQDEAFGLAGGQGEHGALRHIACCLDGQGRAAGILGQVGDLEQAAIGAVACGAARR